MFVFIVIILNNNDIIYHPARTNASITTPTTIAVSTPAPQHHIAYMIGDTVEVELFFSDINFNKKNDFIGLA
jgi:hypothetical protein